MFSKDPSMFSRANLVRLGRLINCRDFLCWTVPTNMSDLATFVAFPSLCATVLLALPSLSCLPFLSCLPLPPFRSYLS